jgi:hypothetical protein
MVVAGGEVHDGLAPGGRHDLPDVRGHEGAAGQRAEVRRLEVAEQGVVAFDRQHGLPRLDRRAVREGAHHELVPRRHPGPVRGLVPRALAQDRDRLVHAAEHGALLLEHLHHDARAVTVRLQHALREVEVRVGVVALPQLLDRQVEDLRGQARSRRHGQRRA